MEEPKCNCPCWQCAIHNHEGCESHSSVCNIQWLNLKEQLENE